jgi:squalene synthase HpnC
MRECRLPVGLFEDLLAAFRQDTVQTRYQTYEELLDYCRRSANPVGRLVLAIAGYAGEEMNRKSDSVCTALQLANFWQDMGRDWQRGRLYVPLEEMRAAGAREQDLDRVELTEPWRAVLASLVARTRGLFDEGREVANMARGRLALELRLTWLGGVRILDRVQQQGYDVMTRRPALGKRDVPAILWRAATWSVR